MLVVVVVGGATRGVLDRKNSWRPCRSERDKARSRGIGDLNHGEDLRDAPFGPVIVIVACSIVRSARWRTRVSR